MESRSGHVVKRLIPATYRHTNVTYLFQAQCEDVLNDLLVVNDESGSA